MVVLIDYEQFTGRHWETGPIQNALAYQGVTAPHTNQPISDALIMGISGGAAFGYFTFEYDGYLPHLILLTRNTFDPMTTFFDRLALPRDIRQTTSAEKSVQNLTDVLESGKPAIVWADRFLLPYHNMPYDERNWRVGPVLVYGLDETHAHLADQAEVPIKTPTEDLLKARARIKKEKFKLMTLGTPNWDLLPAAVSKGLWQCISLYTDAPPKGKRDNFGLAGLQHWAKMLTNQRNKQSWARYFNPGERLWMALVGDAVQPGAFSWVSQGAGNSAERGLFADFLNEAAIILDKPALSKVAEQFRISEAAWLTLSDMLLPDNNPTLKQTKELLLQRHKLFIQQGAGALDAIKQVDQQLTDMQQDAADDFPIVADDIPTFFEGLAEQVLVIHGIEDEAVKALRTALT